MKSSLSNLHTASRTVSDYELSLLVALNTPDFKTASTKAAAPLIVIRSKVMAEAVFSIISEMYDLYRNAHGL